MHSIGTEEEGVHLLQKEPRLWIRSLLTFSLELFPAPVLRASSSLPLLEGSPVNLSCETRVHPDSPVVQLYFSFYVASKALRTRATSSEYQIPTAKTGDSGSYWCEAATEDGNVIKHSPVLELQVLGEWEWWELTGTKEDAPFSPMGLRSVSGDFMARTGKTYEQTLPPLIQNFTILL